MKYLYYFEKIHFLYQNGFFERFDFDRQTPHSKSGQNPDSAVRRRLPHIDPLIISETKLWHENDWSFILIHFVFWWSLAEIIKSGSKLRYQNGSKFDGSKFDFLGVFREIFEMKKSIFTSRFLRLSKMYQTL